MTDEPKQPAAAPSVTLHFGPDRTVVREETDGGKPPISDRAIEAFAAMLLDYLERKGLFKIGSADPPAESPPPKAEETP